MPRLFRGEIIGSLELVKPVKFSGDCEVWLAADSNGDFAILKSAPRNSSEAEKLLFSAEIIKNIKSESNIMIKFWKHIKKLKNEVQVKSCS